VLTKVLAVTRPSIEVVLHIDTAADALRCADRPVLLESPGSVDGGLVGTRGHGDVVGAAVGLEASLALRTAAGVVRAVRLDDIVFYKRVASPAVYSEVAITLWVEGTAIVDGSRSMVSVGQEILKECGILPAISWVPSLATDKVASVAP
jgi:hypothetical protein